VKDEYKPAVSVEEEMSLEAALKERRSQPRVSVADPAFI